MHARSTREAPNILRGLQAIAWWKLAPDATRKFLTAGFGEWKKADYATAALAEDGSCGVVYLPGARTFSVDLSKLKGPATLRWFDPTNGQYKPATPLTLPNKAAHQFETPGKNAGGDNDWLLVLDSGPLKP